MLIEGRRRHFQNISVKAEGGRYQGPQLLPDLELGAVILKFVIAVGLAAEDIKVLVTAGERERVCGMYVNAL